MQATQTDTEKQFFGLINTYPSPHNGQPIVLKRSAECRYDIYFDTARGLTSTPISHLFSFVTVGVFARFLEACGRALGHRVVLSMSLPEEAGMAKPGLLPLGQFRVEYNTASPGTALEQAIRFRQTSRKKYTSGLTQAEQEAALALADLYGLTTRFVDDKTAAQIIWLNQRAVFDDMFNPAVRKELMHWLRFSHSDKMQKKDGLSYDCMELSGGALRFVCQHYQILRWPVVAPLLKSYYLRTMQDESSVGYATAAFERPPDAYKIGQYITDVWLELSKAGAYLHPFGTIVSNEQAHSDFTQLVGLEHESRDKNHVVFIFRAGRSPEPVRSERIESEEHLYKEVGDV